MKRVLFLCTGNYYRSRFAEAYFNWHAQQRGLTWTAVSRGLALDPFNTGAMSRHTVDRLRHHGIPLEPYLRSPLDVSETDFESAHHVVAVKQTEHRPLIQGRFPAWLELVEFWEVHDLDRSGPEEAISHLEREVMALMDRLAAFQDRDL